MPLKELDDVDVAEKSADAVQLGPRGLAYFAMLDRIRP